MAEMNTPSAPLPNLVSAKSKFWNSKLPTVNDWATGSLCTWIPSNVDIASLLSVTVSTDIEASLVFKEIPLCAEARPIET